jgi:hypothetical protein
MEILLLAVIVIIFVLIATDDPNVFHYRPLRFLYRFGFPLYFRVFKVLPPSDKFGIPRWKIEHWMVASGFSKPMAEEDGDGRYILMEFFEIFRFYHSIPLLIRGKISWDNKDKKVVVYGYATWTYFIVFVFLVTMFFVLATRNESICFGAPLVIYFFYCGALYSMQSKRFRSIGERIADYLSADYQE